MENIKFAPGLPDMCYVISPFTGGVVKIYKGENCFTGLNVSVNQIADGLNVQNGISVPQSKAMLGGVLYGWDSRHADPASYTPAGAYTGPVEMMKEGF